MLEQLARDVTGWPARAVEFFEQLATTQYMNHVRLHAPATADLRDTRAMLQRRRRVQRASRTRPRCAGPRAGSGRYNIPNVGIFLWRLQPFRLTRRAADARPRRRDAAAGSASTRSAPTSRCSAAPRDRRRRSRHLAEPINVPEPLDLRLMALAVEARRPRPTPTRLDDDYGAGESIVLLRAGDRRRRSTAAGAGRDLRDICVGDLRDVAGGWAHEAHAAPDSTIAHRSRARPRAARRAGVDGPLLATFHYGFVARDRRRRVRAHARRRRRWPTQRTRRAAATRCSRSSTPSPAAAGC